MLHSRLIHGFVIVALLATPLFLFGKRALAVQDSEDKVLFGPISLATGEGARINVYTVGNPDIAPWTFVVRVFNRQGAIVQGGKFQVAPGAIGSFEISSKADERTVLAALPVRQTLRAEIVGLQPPPDPESVQKYAATLEVYNLLTGRTSILLGGPDTLPAVTHVPSPGQ